MAFLMAEDLLELLIAKIVVELVTLAFTLSTPHKYESHTVGYASLLEVPIVQVCVLPDVAGCPILPNPGRAL